MLAECLRTALREIEQQLPPFPEYPSQQPRHEETGSVDDLVARLENEFEMTLAPGRFFGAPDHFRLGFGVETALLDGALARLGRALV